MFFLKLLDFRQGSRCKSRPCVLDLHFRHLSVAENIDLEVVFLIVLPTSAVTHGLLRIFGLYLMLSSSTEKAIIDIFVAVAPTDTVVTLEKHTYDAVKIPISRVAEHNALSMVLVAAASAIIVTLSYHPSVSGQ